jgi:hypothetical protein
MSDASDHLTRTEYQQRLQPEREAGSDAFAALLAAIATVFGLAAFWLAPFKTGGIAMFIAIIALAASRGRDNAARWAFIIAGLGWFVGTTLAIILDRSPLDI